MVDEQTAIRELYEANVAALNTGALRALEDLYTRDAIQLPPDGPPLIGWEAIRSSLEKELTGIKIDAELKVVETVVSGNWAYALGEYQTRVTPQGAGPVTLATGSWLDILKQQSDGTWRITRSAWSNHGTQFGND